MKMKKNNPEMKKDKDQKEEDKTILGDILDFLKVFIISAIVIFIFVNFVAHPVRVVGSSMFPNLVDGDYGFTNVLSMSLSNVGRQDVVVVTMENENGEVDHWVKRVIGLPGETVEARDGVIYINGLALDESEYLNEDYMEETLSSFESTYGYDYGTFTSDFGPVVLSEDEYFVLGDNRPFSKDSRDPSVGPVSSSQIFGKDILVLWPLNDLGVN